MNAGQYVAFCTEDMAKQLRVLPVELAPGHVVDSRAIQDAVYRMRVAVDKLTRSASAGPQLELFA